MKLKNKSSIALIVAALSLSACATPPELPIPAARISELRAQLRPLQEVLTHRLSEGVTVGCSSTEVEGLEKFIKTTKKSRSVKRVDLIAGKPVFILVTDSDGMSIKAEVPFEYNRFDFHTAKININGYKVDGLSAAERQFLSELTIDSIIEGGAIGSSLQQGGPFKPLNIEYIFYSMYKNARRFKIISQTNSIAIVGYVELNGRRTLVAAGDVNIEATGSGKIIRYNLNDYYVLMDILTGFIIGSGGNASTFIDNVLAGSSRSTMECSFSSDR
jgi:hypothetical protein